MNLVLVIIPAYNEQENIERVVDNLIKNYPQYDYVIVNDGSRDATKQLCVKHQYHLLDLPVNLGLAGGFQAGMKYACQMGYSYAVQLDADGQHRPEYIEPILKKMQEGYDIVIGSRFAEKKKGLSIRMLGSRFISAAIRLTTGTRITDPTSGMRMFNKSMIKEYAGNLNYGPEPDTLSFLIKNGAKVAEVPVTMDERIAGKSYLNLVNSIKYMVRMLISITIIQNFRKRGH